jgi:hypothetical protein
MAVEMKKISGNLVESSTNGKQNSTKTLIEETAAAAKLK